MPENQKTQIYLDFNATAPVRPVAREAAMRAMETVGNPSSVHGFGRAARKLVEDARERVAALVNAQPSQIVFTSGGTEANNQALLAVEHGTVLVSAVEHDSILAPVPEAPRVPVTPDGVLDLDALDAMLAKADTPALVAIMFANNETGVIQPVEEAVAVARRHDALVLCDAVQGAGKVPVDFAALDVDLMTLSGHKIGSPQGTGAVIVHDRVQLHPLIAGGGQERKRRGGTENTPGIAGFGAAAEEALEQLDTYAAVAGLRDAMEAEALARVPAARVFGADAPRVPNTSSLGLPGISSETQVMALDLAGIAVSAGAACSAGKVKQSHVIAAMGEGDGWAGTVIRVSLGHETTHGEVERFLDAWQDLYMCRRAA